jgi:hypothetical protein
MPNIELLKAEISDHLDRIRKLEKEFSRVEHILTRPAGDVTLYDRGAIGYYLHSFYNGCENIFRSIAMFFENELGSDSWHADLLRRMRLEVQGYRPAVIDEELYLLLEDFRGFRHVFRHGYNFDLDWDRELLVASKLERAASMLQAQVRDFVDKLEGLQS